MVHSFSLNPQQQQQQNPAYRVRSTPETLGGETSKARCDLHTLVWSVRPVVENLAFIEPALQENDSLGTLFSIHSDKEGARKTFSATGGWILFVEILWMV